MLEMFWIRKSRRKLLQNNKVCNFCKSNYIEHEINDVRKERLSVEEDLYKITPYLKGIINNTKKSEKLHEKIS